MDSQKFDAWTRVLAGGLPRRGAIKALAGVAVAVATTRAIVHEAEACLEDGQFCTTNDECCGVCISFNCTECSSAGHVCEGPHDCCGGKLDCVDGHCQKKKKVNCEGNGCKKKKKKKHHH